MDSNAIALVPRIPVTTRPATPDDFAFIDRLQTAFAKQLGYMPRAQLESKIAAGHVLIAEAGRPLGYVIGTDRYFKRDDCGIIYQLCVEEGARRSLIGAILVKAMFDRAAYGCRLFCCWCAQDIEANRFWESLGFVPLAFRAGSEKKGRVHIFWQKRIRAGDTTTPWWFPAKTDSGSIREDRLVLPIPPQLRWSDPMPVFSPSAQEATAARLPERSPEAAGVQPPTPSRKRPHIQAGPPPAEPDPSVPVTRAIIRTSSATPPRQRRKADPTLVGQAREIRDRWLEAVDQNPGLLLPQGKYDLARQLPGPGAMKALPDAA